MTDQKLLASIVLFRGLYDNNKDIYDVLSEFIRATILLNMKWSFNSTEITLDLENTFGFNIPEAVIKSCLKNRLQKSGEVDLNSVTYSTTEKLDRTKNFELEYKKSQAEYDEITERLVSFVQNTLATKLTDKEKELLVSEFNKYLRGEHISKQNSSHIGYYILSSESDADFKLKLNRIEEGFVLYEGIRHTSDINNMGSWEGDLTIFLDTEILFHATGLNGALYKRIFDDFNKLVNEVNEKNKKHGSISLRYFDEVKKEVDHFFHTAESIVDKQKSASTIKVAMTSITNGCKRKSDVTEKKSQFLTKLRHLKIEREVSYDYYQYPTYNLESIGTLNSLLEKFNHREENEAKLVEILKMFTKINSLRKGENHGGLERIKAILMTASYLTRNAALSPEIYPGEGAIPFVTDIDFITERLWFKLNKGFGGNQTTPISFDVITKAQLVLSSQINNQVSEEYKKLKIKLENGGITRDEAALFNFELRRKSTKPEEISIESMHDAIDFLDGDFVENVRREKSLLENDAKEGRLAKQALFKIKKINKRNFVTPKKMVARRQYYLLQFSFYALTPTFLIYLISLLYSSSDTLLSLVFGGVTIIGTIATFVKYQNINIYLWRLSKKYYRDQINAYTDSY